MEPGDFVAGMAHYLEVVIPNWTCYLVRDDDFYMLDLAATGGPLQVLRSREGVVTFPLFLVIDFR